MLHADGDTPPPSYSVEHSFADFDHLAAQAREWDLDFLQLDRGAFHGELLQFGVGNVHISEARFGRSLVQKGSPPAGLRTVAIPVSDDVHFLWRGVSVTGEYLLIFPRGAELDSISNPNFHIYTFSIPEECLGMICDSLGVGDLDSLLGNTGAVRCHASAIAKVRNCLSELCRVTRQSASQVHTDHYARLATHELPRRLLHALATSAHPIDAGKQTRREQALVLAETFISRFASDEISVRDIAKATKVSQRTLEYAFSDRYGLTPKAFLMVYRLGALRRCLQAADPARDKVSEIASRYGFWHMGQLAADYRRQFNELPSDTLRRKSS